MSHVSGDRLAPYDTARPLLRCQSRSELVLLGAIVLFHILLCVWFHQGRAFFGDEWGSVDALSQPYGSLLGHFGGWRTMNVYLAVLKLIHELLGGTNWLLVLPGIACGAWLVSVVAAIALRLGGGPTTALTAALLTAMNPWIVSYAVTLRSYIFLAGFSAAMFLALLDWRASGNWRHGWLCGLWAALALLMHLNAVYTFAAIGTLALAWTLAGIAQREPSAASRALRLLIPTALLVAVAAAAYWPALPEILAFRADWSGAPPTSVNYLHVAAARFFGSGYLVLPSLAAIGYGSWRAIRKGSDDQFLLVMVVVPVAAISLAGVQHRPHAYARFLIAIVPMLVLLMAGGIGSCRTRRQTINATLLLLSVAGAQTCALQAARQNAMAIPFHRIAASVVKGPSTRTVLLGRGVHGVGLGFCGVSVERGIAGVLNASIPSEPICLNLIDIGDYTHTLPGIDLGETRVVHLVGRPGDIANRLITTWQSRLTAESRPINGPRLALELAALYQWRGDEAAARRYEQMSRSLADSLRPRSAEPEER